MSELTLNTDAYSRLKVPGAIAARLVDDWIDSCKDNQHQSECNALLVELEKVRRYLQLAYVVSGSSLVCTSQGLGWSKGVGETRLVTSTPCGMQQIIKSPEGSVNPTLVMPSTVPKPS